MHFLPLSHIITKFQKKTCKIFFVSLPSPFEEETKNKLLGLVIMFINSNLKVRRLTDILLVD